MWGTGTGGQKQIMSQSHTRHKRPRASHQPHMSFLVWVSGFGVGGFKRWEVGSGVWSLGFEVVRVWGLKSGFMVWGLWWRIEG